MNREEFVEKVLEIDSEKPEYRLGGDGSDGTCDCVGLCIGAMRRGGIAYNNLHGTNWAARNEAVELWEISIVSELRVGDSVLKAREPGDSGYDLPERYANDRDKRDYYHIGVVVSVNPLKIVHCTTPTTKTDTTLGRWRFAFLWKQLSEVEMKPMYKAEVRLKESKVLHIRSGPGTNSTVVGKIPNGAKCEVLAENNTWSFVRYEGISGYSASAYLFPVEENGVSEKRMILTDSAGNSWTPVGDFRVELKAAED